MHSTTIHVVPIVPDSSKQGCTAPSSVVQKDDVCAVDQYGKCCIAYCNRDVTDIVSIIINRTER